MPLRIHVVHHLSSELEFLIRGIPGIEHSLKRVSETTNSIEELLLMTISPQVQQVLDAIKTNSDLVASVDAGLKAEAKQITDLQTQIAALQAQIAAGGTLSADDVAALASAVTQLGETNATLQADVPANTTAAPAAAPAAPAAGTA